MSTDNPDFVAIDGWRAEPGLVSGSKHFTHPGYPGWMIYDAGRGILKGVITVYRDREEEATFDNVHAATVYVARVAGIPAPADLPPCTNYSAAGRRREIPEGEFEALVTIETVERVTQLALQILDSTKDATLGQVPRKIDRAMALLAHVTDETTTRTVTAVKRQDVSDEISRAARERVTAIKARVDQRKDRT